MAGEVTLNEVLNFKKTLLDELKEIVGATSDVALADINQNFESNIITMLRQIKEQGIGTGTGGTGLTTTQSTALTTLITALNAGNVLSDNNYSDEEKNKFELKVDKDGSKVLSTYDFNLGYKNLAEGAFQKSTDTADEILEGVTHLFLTAEERAKISNAFLLNENTDILTEGNMNLFVTPAEKAKWNGNRTVYPVANIAERDNLITSPPAGVTVQAGDKAFVLDDGDGKHAEYTYTGSMWLKTGDPDWANVITYSANITGKPTTISGYGISDAVDTSTTQTIAGEKTFAGTVNMNGTAKISGWLIVGGYGAVGISGYRNFFGYNSQSLIKFTSTSTGQTTTDGLDIGIASDGTAEIRQRENLPVNMYLPRGLSLHIGDTVIPVSERMKFEPNGIKVRPPMTSGIVAGTWYDVCDTPTTRTDDVIMVNLGAFISSGSNHTALLAITKSSGFYRAFTTIASHSSNLVPTYTFRIDSDKLQISFGATNTPANFNVHTVSRY